MLKTITFLLFLSISFAQSKHEIRVSIPTPIGNTFFSKYSGQFAATYSLNVTSFWGLDGFVSFSTSFSELDLRKLVNLSDLGFTKSYQFMPAIGMAKRFVLNDGMSINPRLALAYNYNNFSNDKVGFSEDSHGLTIETLISLDLTKLDVGIFTSYEFTKILFQDADLNSDFNSQTHVLNVGFLYRF
jgi:hypothetical protein